MRFKRKRNAIRIHEVASSLHSDFICESYVNSKWCLKNGLTQSVSLFISLKCLQSAATHSHMFASNDSQPSTSIEKWATSRASRRIIQLHPSSGPVSHTKQVCAMSTNGFFFFYFLIYSKLDEMRKIKERRQFQATFDVQANTTCWFLLRCSINWRMRERSLEFTNLTELGRR